MSMTPIARATETCNILVIMAKLTVKDLKRLEKIWNQVHYEYENWPYDKIEWAEKENGEYKEVLRRFYNESAN